MAVLPKTPRTGRSTPTRRASFEVALFTRGDSICSRISGFLVTRSVSEDLRRIGLMPVLAYASGYHSGNSATSKRAGEDNSQFASLAHRVGVDRPVRSIFSPANRKTVPDTFSSGRKTIREAERRPTRDMMSDGNSLSVGATGLEPVTSSMSRKRSSQLS